MLAYAADAPKAGGRAGSPKALTLIAAGHAALIAIVLTANPELIIPPTQQPTVLVDINDPPPPPPDPQTPTQPDPHPAIQDSSIDRTPPIVDMGQTTSIELDKGPIQDLRPIVGNDPILLDPPRHVPVKVAARFATPDSAVKPPYPLEKRRSEEEASLKLRLTIDSRGRVTAVEPVGAADPVFLEAARRHILKAWRYKPATEDGVAMPTTTVISLSFRLEDV